MISEKDVIDNFEITDGIFNMSYGKRGKVHSRFAGYTFSNNVPTQINIIGADLSVFVYFKSFEQQFGSIEELEKYLNDALLAIKQRTSNVSVASGESITDFDLQNMHKALESAVGVKIEY